jgi:tetratricopeptide (TPR) repeat protein
LCSKWNKAEPLKVFEAYRDQCELVAQHAEVLSLSQAASLWNEIGTHYRRAARYHDATFAFERALMIDQTIFGAKHPHTARDINNIGLVLRKLGSYEAARDHFEQALKIVEQSLGELNPNAAAVLGNLGRVLQDLGKYGKARLHLEHALTLIAVQLRRLRGQNNGNICQLDRKPNNLAKLLRDTGSYRAAQAAWKKLSR